MMPGEWYHRTLCLQCTRADQVDTKSIFWNRCSNNDSLDVVGPLRSLFWGHSDYSALQCSWLGGFVWKGVVFLIFPPFFQDRFGLLGISWRGSQAVKSTQTEDLEEIVGEGDAQGDQNQGKEEEEEVKGKKSILASKLAKLLSLNQWQLVKSYLSEWQVMERREIGLQKTEQILRLPACHLSQHWCKLVIFTNLASTE